MHGYVHTHTHTYMCGFVLYTTSKKTQQSLRKLTLTDMWLQGSWMHFVIQRFRFPDEHLCFTEP